jgi:hypothetical protein
MCQNTNEKMAFLKYFLNSLGQIGVSWLENGQVTHI